MKAAWFQAFGPAREVLQTGEMDRPSPRPGEVLVRLEEDNREIAKFYFYENSWKTRYEFKYLGNRRLKYVFEETLATLFSAFYRSTENLLDKNKEVLFAFVHFVTVAFMMSKFLVLVSAYIVDACSTVRSTHWILVNGEL